MSFARTPATGPFAAAGTLTTLGPVTKPKKAGGTFTVYEGILNTGVSIDFGFKEPPYRIGDTVNVEVMKEYGKYKATGRDAAPGTPPAPPLAARSAPSAGPGPVAAVAPSYAGRVFPVPREHGDTAILRQNALTNAVRTVTEMSDPDSLLAIDDEAGFEAVTDRVLQVAYRYAAFSAGHLDQELLARLSGGSPKVA